MPARRPASASGRRGRGGVAVLRGRVAEAGHDARQRGPALPRPRRPHLHEVQPEPPRPAGGSGGAGGARVRSGGAAVGEEEALPGPAAAGAASRRRGIAVTAGVPELGRAGPEPGRSRPVRCRLGGGRHCAQAQAPSRIRVGGPSRVRGVKFSGPASRRAK